MGNRCPKGSNLLGQCEDKAGHKGLCVNAGDGFHGHLPEPESKPKVKLDGLGNPVDPEARYFYQDARTYGYDDVLWWGKDRCGYTYDLLQAGVYRGSEVLRDRDTDVPWPEEHVRARIRVHVVIQDLGSK